MKTRFEKITFMIKIAKLSECSFVKGATKLYFTLYSCVVIVLFNTALCRSAFSTVSFRKLVFFVFQCFLWMKTLKYASSCYVILICNFVLTLDRKLTFYKDFLQTKKQFIKVLQYYVKTYFQRCFEFFKKRKSFIKKFVEQLKK